MTEVSQICNLLFVLQKINKYQSRSLCIDIAISDPIIIESHQCLTRREPFVVECDWDLDSFSEFFYEFVDSFAVFRHRPIDIVGHPDYN